MLHATDIQDNTICMTYQDVIYEWPIICKQTFLWAYIELILRSPFKVQKSLEKDEYRVVNKITTTIQ